MGTTSSSWKIKSLGQNIMCQYVPSSSITVWFDRATLYELERMCSVIILAENIVGKQLLLEDVY